MNHSDIEHMAQGYPPAHIAKDSEEVIVWLATQLLTTQEQRDALAAENAELKELYRQSVKELDDTCFEIGMMRGEKSMEYPAPETPATDAYLNSVRADGVDMFVRDLAELFKSLKTGGKPWQAVKGIAMRATSFSEKLRAGEPS